MKKINRYYVLGFIFLFIAIIALLLFSPSSPSVPVVADTLTYQQEVDATLSEKLSKNNYTFENPYVELNPYGNSPLTALIAFSTDEQTSVTLTVEGKDESSTFTHEFPLATDHLIPVYGLYADYLNNVTLTLSNGQTKTLEIQTEALPDYVTLPSSVYADKSQLTNDLYFLTPSSTGYTTAYDVNGDVRWYLTTANIWDVKRLENGNLLLSSDRTLEPPYYMVGLMEMDLLGKIYVEYVLNEGYHHDVIELPNHNLLLAANNPMSSTVEDYIVELDRTTGEVVKSWDLTTILPKDAAKSENWTEYDWFHNNSVDFDEVNQSIILSGRHQDAVISIDYETGALNWIVGDPTGWPEDMQSYFFTPIGEDFEWQWSQHSAKILPTGELAIFDNGNNRSKDPFNYVDANDNYSRGVIYRLDTDQMTIEQVFEYGKERGSSFYSPYISEIDYLDSDHYLIHSGGIGSINGNALNQPAFFYDDVTLSTQTVELLNGERIFELDFPAHFYRASKLNVYTDANNYTLNPGVRVGTLKETQTLPVAVTGLAFNNNELSDDYQIKLSQESDRLIVTGNFIEGQKVKLILNKPREQRVYDIRVTTSAYSAMCVDLFNPDQIQEDNDRLTITKYINADGLSGTYEIYLEIDTIVYPLHQSVTF
ncbi:MAG: aryl-sulfate sulfotransferase [Turicibacter sp.]|nr:aryl-sulfate sulfotransferase [Turicibacter sp.]